MIDTESAHGRHGDSDNLPLLPRGARVDDIELTEVLPVTSKSYSRAEGLFPSRSRRGFVWMYVWLHSQSENSLL